jgi:hypothetical protein
MKPASRGLLAAAAAAAAAVSVSSQIAWAARPEGIDVPSSKARLTGRPFTAPIASGGGGKRFRFHPSDARRDHRRRIVRRTHRNRRLPL